MLNYSLLVNSEIKNANTIAALYGADSFISSTGAAANNTTQYVFNNVTQSGTVNVTHSEPYSMSIIQVYELQPDKTGVSNTTLDFDLADEAYFVQENSTIGTDFRDGIIQLHLEESTDNIDDGFTTLNALRWYMVTYGAATITSVGGKVRITVPYNNITSDRAFLYDNFTFIGDFDIQVSFSNLNNYVDNYHAGIDIKNQPSNAYYASIYRNNNGWFSNIDGNIVTANTTTLYGAMRITRVGNVFTTYVATNENPVSWSQVDSRTVTAINETNFSLRAGTAYDGGSINIDFDDFKINSGVHYDYSSGEACPNTKWVTTSNNNHINLGPVTEINSIDITTVLPTNTDIGCLVSFDGRTTWKTWNGSAFVDHAGLAVDTDWSTITEIESAFTLYAVTDEVYLDFAFLLETAHASVTPSVDQISLNYNEEGVYKLQTAGDYIISNKSSTYTTISKMSAGTANIKINALLS